MARPVSVNLEQAVLRTHAWLTSPRDALGFYGAEAIAHELADLGVRLHAQYPDHPSDLDPAQVADSPAPEPLFRKFN